MKEIQRFKPDTVNMLLNPKMFSGRHEGRTTPWLLTLILIIAPILIFSNQLLYLILAYRAKALILIIPIYIFYCFRIIAVFILREKERLARYKKEQVQKYTHLDELTTIKRIHQDGCIEYYNGTVSYFVYCKNGNRADPLARSSGIEKFLITCQDYNVNVYVYNVVDATTIENRYKNISIYTNKTIAKDTLEIMDYNKKYVEDNSLVTVTVFELHGQLNSKVMMKGVLTDAIRNLDKSYREAKIADVNLANYILNRNLCTNIDYRNLFMKRYAKGNYYRNKVVSYDKPYVDENDKISQEIKSIERGFIPWQTK